MTQAQILSLNLLMVSASLPCHGRNGCILARFERTAVFWYNAHMKTKTMCYVAFRLFSWLLLAGAGLFGFVGNAVAAYAQNAYVSVVCDEALGVYAVNSGFYVLCPSETTGSLCVRVAAQDPFRLDMPETGYAEIAPGGSCSYCVSDESGSEDSYSGVIRVLKLAIKSDETNVCWKASQCTLRLTSDSNPGGKAYWTSRPAGISGTGRSITFNPQNLSPGGYMVTVCSEIVPSYTDQALVNVVKVTEL